MGDKILKNEKITTSSTPFSLTTAKNHLQKQIWQRPVIEVINSTNTGFGPGQVADGDKKSGDIS